MKNAFEPLSRIYNALADDESRFIFGRRLLYSLNPDQKYIREITHQKFDFYVSRLRANLCGMPSIKELKAQHELNPRKIVFYGTGFVCETTIQSGLLEYYGLPFHCFCDQNPDKQKQPYRGCAVISPERLIQDFQDSYVLINLNLNASLQVHAYLVQNGFSPEQLFIVNCIWLKAGHDQYFSLPALSPVENEVYIDCGCYDELTIRNFIRFCKGRYKKIYGLEPNPEQYELIKRGLADIKELYLLKKGAWSDSTVLQFTEQDICSHISDEGSTRIETVSIDEIAENDRVTFIKMDIEGAELQALKGARKTIQRHKPRLAVSIYHKPEDIIEIPNYIQSLVPEYSFYIRHHHFFHAETVLYAL
jgi:FkbM family methyltransferase